MRIHDSMSESESRRRTDVVRLIAIDALPVEVGDRGEELPLLIV